MKQRADIDIFQYRDYRQFLREYYHLRKNSEYGFSYRRFAREVGSSSPNYLKLVTEGKRNLASDMAVRFAKACGLKGESAEYFCDLVLFNQSSTDSERDLWYRRLNRYKGYRRVYKLDKAQTAYCSEWYIPAIRELTNAVDFKADPKWIAGRLRPRITPKKAKQALDTLLELGLLKEDGKGGLSQTEPLVSTGEGPLSHHIVKFHHTMLKRAGYALDTVPRENREFGALTLCVSEERYQQFKQELYKLRQRLLQESLRDNRQQIVAQINFQLFPLTQKGDSDE